MIEHRLGTAEVDLGVPDAAVTVEQTSHAFGFGCIGFDLIDHACGDADRSALASEWLALFNRATLPFYWGRFEAARGRPDTARLRAAAAWFADRGVLVKGHPLVWHTVKPDWLDALPLDEAEALLRARIRREVADFRGLVGEWDAINEAVIMPEFANEPDGVENAVTRIAQRLGRTGMIRLAVEEAREADPSAVLIVNDFDLSERYERVVGDALDAGIRIDGIGLQTHMHQGFRGEDALLAICDRFARFELPLHFTETSLVSGDLMPPEVVDLNDFAPPSWPSTPGGEARQADEIVRHYRALASHPAVASIAYWGITDDDAWLGAPIGLLRADGSRKPAYHALHALVKGEWWLAPVARRTDADGRLRVSGWRGDYRAVLGDTATAFTIS